MINIIDLHNSKQKNPLLSETLHANIQETLKKKETILLYLNRVGFSSFLICKDCGESPTCRNCWIPLRVFKENKKTFLYCKKCNIKEKYPEKCSKCHGIKIEPIGNRIQKVTEGFQNIFPETSIFSIDSSSKKITKKWQKDLESANIIIATKSFENVHIPNIGLLGFLCIDTDLHIPRYNTEEKLYLFVKNFEKKNIPVHIQTYTPNHLFFKKIFWNYKKFFIETLKERKKFFFPPYSQIGIIKISGGKKEDVEKNAENFYNECKKYFHTSTVVQSNFQAYYDIQNFSCTLQIKSMNLEQDITNIEDLIEYRRDISFSQEK